ncbi:hypothetical protein M426DRAFT_317602 [Hypoxylon sp. CI-4A]|nr:hypothetical protein M426DRAFT_317602 [Hypoxylon sp. CI-4A]
MSSYTAAVYRLGSLITTGAIGAAFGGVLIGPILAALGFGAAGIAASSTAAGWQSGIGNVVAPSLFASLQSAGMAGYAALAVKGTAASVTGVIALATRIILRR